MPDGDGPAPGSVWTNLPAGTELPSSDDFARVVGSSFTVQDGQPGDGAPELTIDHVEVGAESEGRCFSVFFSAPGPHVLPQRTYRLRHEELGELALFLVPIGMETAPPDAGPDLGPGLGSDLGSGLGPDLGSGLGPDLGSELGPEAGQARWGVGSIVRYQAVFNRLPDATP